MVGIVFSSGAIVREKERGTFEQLLVTPINPVGLVLGKLGPYLFLGIVETAIVLLLMRFAFGVPIQGSLLFLFAMVVVYLFTCVSAGLLISTKASTQMESFQIAQSLFLPAIFLSGYIFPFSGMPFFLRAIGQVFPTTHMIRIMRGIILRDANPLDLWPSVAALVLTSIVMVFFAARSVHKVAA
jgi:ABC-2 type transport system permease protein